MFGPGAAFVVVSVNGSQSLQAAPLKARTHISSPLVGVAAQPGGGEIVGIDGDVGVGGAPAEVGGPEVAAVGCRAGIVELDTG